LESAIACLPQSLMVSECWPRIAHTYVYVWRGAERIRQNAKAARERKRDELLRLKNQIEDARALNARCGAWAIYGSLTDLGGGVAGVHGLCGERVLGGAYFWCAPVRPCHATVFVEA
jgi:hypothetical protein